MEKAEHTRDLQIVEAKELANGDRWHVYLADKAGRKIAALWGKQREKEANARLFRAAPDLLDALDDFQKIAAQAKPNCGTKLRSLIQTAQEKHSGVVANARGQEG